MAKKLENAAGKSLFSGQLAGVDWANIVRYVEWNRKSGVLVFRDENNNKIGCLYFDNGDLVDARTRRFEKEEAFFALWGLRKGHFEFFARDVDISARIENRVDALLVEASRMEDECREFIELLSRSNPVLSLDKTWIPSELVDAFGEGPLCEIFCLIAEKNSVKRILQCGRMSHLRAGSILNNLLRKNYISIARQ